MVNKVYSGFAIQAAHFDFRPPPPGLATDHTTGQVEPDPFNPTPDTPAGQEGTIWQDLQDDEAGQSGQPNLAAVPVSHWYPGQAAVPSGVPYGTAQQAMQERMMADHSVVNYVHDSIRLYQHASEGQANEFTAGRPPIARGSTLPTDVQFLANGRNSFDQVNQPNEVYGSGGESNVGNYRLGVKTNVWGLYESPLGKFGQDALLHAYTGLTAQFPAERNQMNQIAAPYTPNSSGANGYWKPASSWQDVSMFGVPSETAITDFSTQAANFDNSGDFMRDERL